MFRKTTLSLILAVTAFAPLIDGGTTHLPVFILKLLVVAAGLGFIYTLYTGSSVLIHRTGYEFPLIALSLAVCVSVFIAPSKYMAFVWVQLIVFYIIFFHVATWTYSGSKDAYRYAAYTVLLAGAVQAVVGYYQYSGGDTRVNGTFFNPNMMAGYVSACACMAVSLGIWAVGNDGRRVTVRAALYIGYAAACVSAIVLSGSRGGILALAAGIGVVLWFRFRFLALLGAGLIVAGILIIPNPVRERVFSLDADPLAYKRVDIWKSAYRRIEDHPMGLGLGNFKYYSDAYAFPVEESVIRYGTTARTAHNEYLHFTAEAGVLGLFAMGYLLYQLALMLSRTTRRYRGRQEFPVLAGAVAGIAALLAHSLVDSNLHEPGIVFLLLTLVAVCSAYPGMPGDVKDVPRKPSGRILVLGTAALLLLGIWGTLPYLAYVSKEKGVQASREGRLYSALDYAEKAVTYQPFNPDYLSGKAASCFALFARERVPSMFEQSLELLNQAERLNTINSRYPALRSYVLSEGSQLAKDPAAAESMLLQALEASDRAVELAPYQADPGYNRAVLLVKLERLEEAEQELERVVALEPSHMKSRLLLARIYGATGRRELSTQTARSIIEDYETLTKRPLNEQVRLFIKVDLDEARRLAEPGVR